jgi:cell division protein FtsW (lipid II flippase)/cell division protein FtsI/penicillin-binding protein 2
VAVGNWHAKEGQETRGYAAVPWQLATPAVTNLRERLLLVLAGLFVVVGAVTLALTGLGHWSAVHWLLAPAWVLGFGVAHAILVRRAPGRDPFLLPLAGLLTGWGLLLIARLADVAFLIRQVVWMAAGIGIFVLIVSRTSGLRWLRRYRYTWLLGGLALLAATLVWGSNPSGYGPRLWLGGRVPGLGVVYIQPSEILKLLMVAYLASYLAEKRVLVMDGPRVGWTLGRLRRTVRLPSFPYLAPLLIMWGLAMILLAWQQDLGAALLFFFTFLVMLYHASESWGYVAGGAILFLIAAAGAYLLIDTVELRVDIWLHPWSDPAGRAFQIVQSLIAMASGGVMGQGLAQGNPTYIPAIHTDFPFSAIAEEFGLVGVLGLIASMSALSLRGVRVALNARSPFRRLLAAGLATLLGLQSWIIMAGNSKLIPLTGITLPFVSYGGSSLVSSFVVLALITVISQDEPMIPLLEGGRGSSRYNAMRQPIRRVSLALLAGFGGVALISGYWMLIQRQDLMARQDNPRLVEAEQQVRRGPIFDRHRVVLARSQEGESGIRQRIYFTPTVPAVGYYSLKHGVGGIEASYDTLLRGMAGRSQTDQLLDDLLHRQPRGLGIMLSLDAELHKEIIAMLQEPPETTGSGREQVRGALVLLDISSGEILAMVSQPTFDPNTLDADWGRLESDPDAPLINRATQGLYQPGGILQPVVLAAAMQAGLAQADAEVENPVQLEPINGSSLGCVHEPAGPTLADAVAAGCPSPIARLGEQLGADALELAFHQWGLDTAPPLSLLTEAGTNQIKDARLAAVGQETLTVTPLHAALIAAAIGNRGAMPGPRLILKTETGTDTWQAVQSPIDDVQVMDANLAQRLYALFEPSADGLVRGRSSLALAGTDSAAQVWYTGFAPDQAPHFAVVVLLEHAGRESLDWAAQIGHDALLVAMQRTP